MHLQKEVGAGTSVGQLGRGICTGTEVRTILAADAGDGREERRQSKDNEKTAFGKRIIMFLKERLRKIESKMVLFWFGSPRNGRGVYRMGWINGMPFSGLQKAKSPGVRKRTAAAFVAYI